MAPPPLSPPNKTRNPSIILTKKPQIPKSVSPSRPKSFDRLVPKRSSRSIVSSLRPVVLAGLSAVSGLSVSSRWSPSLRLVVLPGLSAVSGLAVSLVSPSRRAGLRHRPLSLALSANTHDQEVFSFHRDHSPCDGFEEVLNCYKQIAQLLRLSEDKWTMNVPTVDGGSLKPDVVEGTDDEVPYFVEIKRTIPKGSVQSKDFKTKKIFVGGVPTTVSEDEFENFFSKHGKVVEHQIIRDHNTNRSRGFGFIIFDHEQVVDDLLANGNMIDMVGTRLTTTVMSFASFGSQVCFQVAGPRTPGLGGRLGGYGGYSGGSELGGGYGGFGGSGLGAYRDNQQLQSELNGRRGSCTAASSSFNQQQAASNKQFLQQFQVSQQYHSSSYSNTTTSQQQQNFVPISLTLLLWNTWLVTFGAHSSFRRDERMSLGSYLHDRYEIRDGPFAFQTDIFRLYFVSNQKRNPFSVSDRISDDVFRDGTHSVSVPFLIAIRDGILANQKRKILFLICMDHTKMISSGEDTHAEIGGHVGWRAQTTSYRKLNELGQKADDLDKGSALHASSAQGREVSVHKTLVPPVESFSLESSEEDREQVVKENNSIKKESEKEDGKECEIEGNEQEKEEDKEKDIIEQVVRERANCKGHGSKAKAGTLCQKLVQKPADESSTFFLVRQPIRQY
ncbi:hypothetical protein Syun_029664 [Stephania yunnanensis]|uniref:RRM domain-containing protein n=1 Tax=Stephania yunnanensis TaxID=152371 RepID=A0AAP0HLK3_9MAGN